MIAIVAKALGISDVAAWAGSVLLALALVGGAWGLHQVHASAVISDARAAGRAEGKTEERAAWEAASKDERKRQAEINDRLAEMAMLEQARLRAERDDLAKRIEELDHEADIDPGRDRISLPAASVRRVDAIR